MKTFSRILVSALFIALATVVITASSATVWAAEDPLDAACDAGSAKRTSSVCKDTGEDPLVGATGVITRATQLLAIAVGVVAVIMIIVGGFRYVVSGGNAESINSAKNTILYAIIGLVVALVAQALVLFVLKRL